jgi:hypothetical protein
MRRVLLLVCALMSLRPMAVGSRGFKGFSPEAPAVNAIPSRTDGAVTGSEFARRTADMSRDDREEAALEELRSGNIPGFLKSLKPVTLHLASPHAEATATIWVMPDYLAIGSDDDFLRIPLSYDAATAIASEYGFALPTPKMVDAIYAQSALHLEPQPLPAGRMMSSNSYYLDHQTMIQKQLWGQPQDALVAGHKKDLVLTNRLRRNPHRVAIYGWHRRDGKPIQPLSTVHQASYADYSHGIRLVSTTVQINGTPRSIYDVLEDPELAPLLTDEGMIAGACGLMHCRK